MNSSMRPDTANAAPAVAGPLDARAIGVMTLLCLLWSLQQVSLKAIEAQASPMAMVALRSVIAIVLLLALMARRGELPGPGRWRPGLAVGALFGLEYLLVTAALGMTQASHVIVFLYTAPISAALGLQLRLPEEKLARMQWAGIFVAFCGIAIAFLGGGHAQAGGAGSRALLGDALALLSGVAWGATTVTLRGSSLATAPATETLLYQLLGGVALGPIAWWIGQWRFEPSALVFGHLAFQSVVVSFASFLAWCWLLRLYLASQLGVFSFLTPLFGVVLGVWLLGDTLEGPFVVGSALVLVGIGVVSAHAPLTRGLASLLRWFGGARRGALR